MPDPIAQLVDRLQDGEISRRSFVEGALRLGLSVSAAGTLLAACGGSSSSSSSSSSGSGAASSSKVSGKVQIFVGFGTGNQPAQIPVQQALADAFTKQNPDVTISFLRVPSGARDKFTTLLAGGTPPDLVMPVGLYGVSLFVDQNVWMDLGSLVERDGISLDAFSKASTPAIRVPNFYGANSKAVIGLPVSVNDHALAYNADLFAKAGVPEPPQSWTDDSWTLGGKFLDAARALTIDKGGKHAGESGFDPGNIVQFGLGHFFRETIFYDFGGHLYDASSKKAQFDQSGAIAGLQFAADLINKEHVQPSQSQTASLGAGAAGGDAEQFAWRAGKLAMIDMCTCDIKSPFGTNVPFKFKAAAMPAGPGRRFCFLNLDLGAIPQASKNKDAAWEVLKFFAVTPENERQLSYGSYGGVPPLSANQSAFPDGITKDLPGVNPQEWLDGFSSASPENEAWFPAFTQVNDLVGKAFDQVTNGDAQASAALPQLQQQAQAAIDQWFKTHTLPNG